MRYRFFPYKQSQRQTTDFYTTEQRTRSGQCEFGELKNSLIRNRIVILVYDKKTKVRLLRTSDFTLDKARHICRAADKVKHQADEIQRSVCIVENNSKVDYISNSKYRPKSRPNDDKGKSRPSVNKGTLKITKKHSVLNAQNITHMAGVLLTVKSVINVVVLATLLLHEGLMVERKLVR